MIYMIKCIIFDLDGTLVETIDDLGLACDYLLKEKGIEPKWTKADYKQFVGNGAKLLVERAFEGKLSPEELEKQYELFKIKYNEIKLDNAYAYEGMKDVVNTFKQNGFKVAVCTNKPNTAAVDMVKTLYGEDTFDYILGATDDVAKKPNTEMPNIILNHLNIKPNDCVWIGDSSVDIETAKNLGCESIAVTWGFRPFSELFKCYPTVIVDKPKEILKFFNLVIDKQ